VAVVGAVGIIGYSIFRCYKKKKSLSMSAITSCIFTGTIESLAGTAKDLGKETYKKLIKPGAVGLYKKGLKPIGVKTFNKVLKPAYKSMRNIPKKIAHDSQKALKKVGKKTKSGLKKAVSFGLWK
jgi:hypothetical protein